MSLKQKLQKKQTAVPRDSKLLEKIENMLNDSPFLAESEREFWLAAVREISHDEQKKLLKNFEITRREHERETSRHADSIAEITKKFSLSLGKIQKENAAALKNIKVEDEAGDDFDPDTILEELHDLGEY